MVRLQKSTVCERNCVCEFGHVSVSVFVPVYLCVCACV